MLKELEFTDFSQFIAALKAAEKLDLTYRVERKQVSYTRKVTPLGVFGQPMPDKTTDVAGSAAVFYLTIVPDEVQPLAETAWRA